MKQNNKKDHSKYNGIIIKGLDNIKKGEINAAISNFQEAINLNSLDYKAFINLANAYILTNKLDLAINILFKFLREKKFEKNIANHLADICFHYKLYDYLLDLFNFCKTESNKKKEIEYILFVQGKYFEHIKEHKKAIKSYKASVQKNKNFFKTYELLLNLLESVNDIDNLEKYTKLALRYIVDSKNYKIILFFQSLLLYRKKNYKKVELLIKQNNLLTELSNTSKYYIKVLDLLSKNSERLNKYDDAFKFIENRNNFEKNLKENKKFSSNLIIETIEKYKKFYTKDNFKSICDRLEYNDDSNLVFLVGFPRSGTTLLDTILRSHSQIKVLEERPVLLDLRHNFFEKKNNNLFSLKNISQREKDFIRNSYFEEMGLTNIKSNEIIIDKLPLSIIELGFIKCIFPTSKIILALRNPNDVIISCFFSSFKINDAMINFLDWNNTINLYDKTFELYEFYENELKLNCFKIKYENVVNNFKDEIKSLLQYLDVPYEKDLENFYITAQKRDKISTPSYNQVINPLYKSSIGRWKNYKNIKKSSAILNKWIKKFSYQI